MKKIAIVSRKGGVGKSTLTMNLAVVAGPSTIIDTDPRRVVPIGAIAAPMIRR